jgi:hypothetical protein
MTSSSDRHFNLSSDLITPTIADMTIQPVVSDILRSQWRQIMGRMCSDSGNVAPTDVLGLLAIFQKSRNATLSHQPQLSAFEKAYILDKLLTHSSFHKFHNFDDNTLFHLQRYITLLAEAFRSFRDNDKFITIENVICNVWYEGINKLSKTVNMARIHSHDQEIEWWDTKITLNHCEYMLLSMTDSENFRDLVLERGRLLIKGIWLDYGNQFFKPEGALDGILLRQRREEPWQEDYLKLKEIYFEGFSHTERETHDNRIED